MNNPATIAFKCSCGHGMKAKREHGGRRAKCPKCQQAVTIPVAGPQQARPQQTRSQQSRPQSARPQASRPQSTRPGQPAPRPGSMPNQPMQNQPMPGAPLPGAPLPGAPMPGTPMPAAPMPNAPMPNAPMPAGQMPPGQMPPPGFPGASASGNMTPAAPMPGAPFAGAPMPTPSGQGNLPLGYSVPTDSLTPGAAFPSPGSSGPGQSNSMSEQTCPSCGSFYPFSQPHCAKCRFSRSLGKKIPYQSLAQPVARMQAPPPRPKKKSPDDEHFGMKVMYMVGGLLLTLVGFGVGFLMVLAVFSSETGGVRVRAFFLPAFIIASGFGLMAKGFVSD